jgi:ABC-type microcin C transport system permease subunit YejE
LEIKINKEIRDYTESVFFGLSLRQFMCALGAVAAAVGCYFGLRNLVGTDVVTWYNGMPAEHLAIAWLRSELLLRKPLPYLKGGTTR